MAEGDATIYDQCKLNLAKGYINLASDPFKVALVSGYTPDYAADDAWADVSDYEYTSGANYTAGGISLTGVTLSLNSTLGSVLWDADNPQWNNLGPLSPATPDYAIIYSTKSLFVGSPLIEAYELGVTASNGGPYKLTWNALGLAALD
jgi:hypothetical protein